MSTRQIIATPGPLFLEPRHDLQCDFCADQSPRVYTFYSHAAFTLQRLSVDPASGEGTQWEQSIEADQVLACPACTRFIDARDTAGVLERAMRRNPQWNTLLPLVRALQRNWIKHLTGARREVRNIVSTPSALHT